MHWITRTVLVSAFLSGSAWAGVDPALWAQHQGQQVALEMIDGSQLVGVIVAIEGDQVRIRKTGGAVVLVPTAMARSINGQSTVSGRPTPVPVPVPAVPLPRAPAAPPLPAPAVQPVPRATPSAAPLPIPQRQLPVLKRLRTRIVGVRYRIQGLELGEHAFWDEQGNARPFGAELERPRALRDYVFIDEDGVPMGWQTGWSRMGLEHEYVELVKEMNRKILPIQITEALLAVPGLVLVSYASVQANDRGVPPQSEPMFIGGAAMLLSNIVLSVAVHGPTKGRLKAELGRTGLITARDLDRPAQ